MDLATHYSINWANKSPLTQSSSHVYVSYMGWIVLFMSNLSITSWA